jgi:AcrR family transcriptional regulator
MRDTKNQFLAAARELFATQGYDRTTVEAVIARLGLSKGAFYHHFSSKEDLLDGVMDQIARERLLAVEPVLREPLGALDKMNRFLAANRAWRLENIGLVREMLAVLARDENAIIRQKINRRNVELGLPLMTEILRQGAAEGVFNVPDAELTAELLLEMGNGVTDAQARSFGDPVRMRRRMEVYMGALERILAAPKGSIERPDFTAVAKALEKA